MGKALGLNFMPASDGEAVAKSAKRGAYLQQKLEQFKRTNNSREFERELSKYKDDIKAGNFRRISQNDPDFYEALLKDGIAPESGVDYNNYQKMHIRSIFSEESKKLPTPKTSTEQEQNPLKEIKMDEYTPQKKNWNQIDVMS